MLQQNVRFIKSKAYVFKYCILLDGIYNTLAELMSQYTGWHLLPF